MNYRTITVSRIGSVINFSLTNWIFSQFVSAWGGDKPFCKPQVICTTHDVHYNGTIIHYIKNGPDKNCHDNIWPGNFAGMAYPPEDKRVACDHALAATFWLGDALIALSFLAALAFIGIDKKVEK